MDNFGDYIYIILLVIAAISGFLKKRANKEPQTETAPQKSWEELMQDLEAETEAEKQAAATAVVPEVVGVQRQAATASHSANAYEKQQATPKSTTKRGYTPIEQIEAYALDEIQFSTPSDARQAFIYAEIFQRKWT